MQFYLSRKRSILFAIGLSFLVGVFLLFALGYYLVSPAKKGGHDQLFLVRDGSTLKEVVGELNTREIITSKRLFLLWARLMGYSTNIKAGEYLLNSGMPPLKILNILSKGTILTHPVTIPEGFTRKQIGEILEKRGLTNKQEFLSLTGNPDIAKRYGIGQTFPGSGSPVTKKGRTVGYRNRESGYPCIHRRKRNRSCRRKAAYCERFFKSPEKTHAP